MKCPYCNKRQIKRKATCGNLLCQGKHHLKLVRENSRKNRMPVKEAQDRSLNI